MMDPELHFGLVILAKFKLRKRTHSVSVVKILPVNTAISLMLLHRIILLWLT